MAEFISIKKDLNSCIAACVTMSPSARKSIDNYYYLYRLDQDSVDYEDILRELVTDILVDLRVIGITANISAADLNMSDSTMVDFLNLCTLLLPNTLYQMMRRSDVLTQLIRGIADGSIGENEPAVITYLKELIGYETGYAFVPELANVVELLLSGISSSEIYLTYLNTLLSDLDSERLMAPLDPTLHEAFVKMIRTWEWDIVLFTDRCKPHVSEADLQRFTMMTKQWIRSLSDPDQIVWTSYLFLTDPQTLPANIHDLFLRRAYGYQVSTPLYLDYYKTRMITEFTVPQQMMLILGCLMSATIPTDLQARLNTLPFSEEILNTAATDALIARG